MEPGESVRDHVMTSQWWLNALCLKSGTFEGQKWQTLPLQPGTAATFNDIRCNPLLVVIGVIFIVGHMAPLETV